MQAHFVVLGNRDALWQQQSNLTTKVNTWIPLGLGILAVILAGAVGGVVTLLTAALALAFVVLSQPRFGLYMLAVVVAADSAGYDPLTASLWRIYQPIPGGYATPVELLILWTGFCWLVRAVAESRLQLPDRTVLFSSIALTFFILVGIANGINRGGSFTMALWETRSLLAVPPLLLMTCGLLQERRHVVELVGVTAVSITLMTVELAWRYLALVRGGNLANELEAAFSHDGAMMVAVLAVAGAAAVLWGPEKRAKLLGLVVSLLAFGVLLAARRRAALVGMEAGFIALAVVLLLTNWRRFAVMAPVALVLGVLYLGAFWNNPNSLGQPARVFRTVFMSGSVNQRDRASDDYRRIENINIWAGVRARPLSGHGFGLPYPKPLPMPNLSSFWPLWEYIPHNTILWLWHKGGIMTFMAFWFFIGTAVSQAVQLAWKLRSPFFTATIGCALGYLVMTVLFSYVDLGLVSMRPMVLFGMTLGLLSAVNILWLRGEKALTATQPEGS